MFFVTSERSIEFLYIIYSYVFNSNFIGKIVAFLWRRLIFLSGSIGSLSQNLFLQVLYQNQLYNTVQLGYIGSLRTSKFIRYIRNPICTRGF